MCFTVLMGTPMTNSERKPVMETMVTHTPLGSDPSVSRMKGVSHIIAASWRPLTAQFDPMCFSTVLCAWCQA